MKQTLVICLCLVSTRNEETDYSFVFDKLDRRKVEVAKVPRREINRSDYFAK